MVDSDALEKLKKLSVREKEILKLFCEGYLYREIAKKLYISNSSVKSHMCNIYVKLGLDLLPRRARTFTLSDVYCKALKESESLPSEEESVEAGTEETVEVNVEETGEVDAEEASSEPISRALLKIVEEDDGGPHKDHEGEIIKIVPVNPPDKEKQFKPNPFMIGFLIVALFSILFTGYSIYNRFFGPTPVPPSVSSEKPEQAGAQASSSDENQPDPTFAIQSSPTMTEAPTATATLPPKPAVLFEDNFDKGLSEAWEVISGNPIIVNGMLTTDQDTWLLVGDSEWVNYSIEFRTDSNNGFFWEGYNTVGIHVLDIDNMYAYKWAEYECASYIIENGNWNEVPQSEFDPSNEMKNFRLTIENSLITIYENGEKRTSYYDSRFEKGRIAIKMFAETVIDDFIVREILE